MDDRERIPADTPRSAFQLFPCFGMVCSVETFGCSAHVATNGKQAGFFNKHHLTLSSANMVPVIVSAASES